MKEKNLQFLKELETYERQGIHMLLDGVSASPQEIYQTCILREDTSYMCDFIFEDDNKLEELYFRKVDQRKCK